MHMVPQNSIYNLFTMNVWAETIKTITTMYIATVAMCQLQQKTKPITTI
jgi:hypothetical protein